MGRSRGKIVKRSYVAALKKIRRRRNGKTSPEWKSDRKWRLHLINYNPVIIFKRHTVIGSDHSLKLINSSSSLEKEVIVLIIN